MRNISDWKHFLTENENNIENNIESILKKFPNSIFKIKRLYSDGSFNSRSDYESGIGGEGKFTMGYKFGIVYQTSIYAHEKPTNIVGNTIEEVNEHPSIIEVFGNPLIPIPKYKSKKITNKTIQLTYTSDKDASLAVTSITKLNGILIHRDNVAYYTSDKDEYIVTIQLSLLKPEIIQYISKK